VATPLGLGRTYHEGNPIMRIFGRFLDGYCNVHVQLWDYLRDATLAALDAHARAKADMASSEDVVERGRMIRQAFLDSLGGLPELHGPVNAQVTGTVPRDGYRIEKVIYESAPQVHVTSLLYVPEHLDGPAPAVLFVCGHGREAKAYPEYQRVCHDLARNGFVVLAVDPTGQGERVTHLDPDSGDMTIGWGTTEHSYQGHQCVLTGTSIAQHFLFDALRGLDYLESRDEVDADRIGVTGQSGGGTQTSLICMSGDPRVKVAIPCTYITSREHYYQSGQPQDAEQLQFGMTANGINFDDFFLPFAPGPLLIGAVASDFFNPEGTALTYDRLLRAYDLLGHADDVQCAVTPGTHKYSDELREAAVNWFRLHLAEVEPDFVTKPDDDIEILPDSELWCTSKGHVLTDYPDAKTPYHLNLANLPEDLVEADLDTLRDTVIDTLGIRGRLESAVELFSRESQDKEEDGFRVRSVDFISEPGIHLAAGLITRPGEEPDEVCIYLTPGGTSSADEHLDRIRELTGDGQAVLMLDVRGKGAVAADPVNLHGDEFPGSLFNTETWFAYAAYCLGESLLGMRVFDVLRAAHYLRSERGYQRIGLYAEGLEPALWGYLTAAINTSIDPVRVDGLIESFRAVVETQLYRTDFTASMMVHGILHRFDLPGIRLLFGGRALDVTAAPAEF
jgi:X-Pro dipeptidyl-peptidase (S15 family)